MWLGMWVLESDRRGYESWLYVLLTVCDLGKPLRALGPQFPCLKKSSNKILSLAHFPEL